MYSKYFEIENIKPDFKVVNDQLYVLDTTGKVSILDIGSTNRIWSSNTNEKGNEFFLLDKHILLIHAKTTSLIDALQGNMISEKSFYEVFKTSHPSKVLATSRLDNEFYTSLFDIKENREQWSIPIKLGKNIICLENSFINSDFYTDQDIHMYDLNYFSRKWSFDIRPYANYTSFLNKSKSGIIDHFIGVYNDILWVAISSGKLLGIDISNGNLKHEIGVNEILQKEELNLLENSPIPWGAKMQLDQTSGEIIGLRGHYFMRIDLKAKKLTKEYFDISQTLDKHKIEASYSRTSFPIDNRYLYFCDDQSGKIGIFDRDKRKVVWSHQMDTFNQGITQIIDMKYQEDKWFILDRHNRLHIFQKSTSND